MTRRYTFTLHDADDELARAHAKDRGLKVPEIARAALMSDVKRSLGRDREHLLAALVAQLRPLLAPDAQNYGPGGADALAAPSARAERAEAGRLA